MGCGSSKPAIEDSPLEQAGQPQELVRLPAPAPAPSTSMPSSEPHSAREVVPSPGGTSGPPAHYTAQHVGETPSPKPHTAPLERKRSRAPQRPGDGGGYPSSPHGVAVADTQHPHHSEMDSTQHQSRKRVPSKLEKSPSMDLLGARARPPDRITRTTSASASTSLYPNTYPPPGSHFKPQPASRTIHTTPKRHETRQFPPNLQSLLSNDFRYAVRRCPISHYYYVAIVHRFRVLVVGRVRVVKLDSPWTQLMHVSLQRESGKSSLINAIFNVDMSVCI